ncbi:hypothetical protein GCM10008969_25170 [Pseudomonas veronii subsp. inensis]
MRSIISRISATSRIFGTNPLSTCTALARILAMFDSAKKPNRATSKAIKAKPRPARRAMDRLRRDMFGALSNKGYDIV